MRNTCYVIVIIASVLRGGASTTLSSVEKCSRWAVRSCTCENSYAYMYVHRERGTEKLPSTAKEKNEAEQMFQVVWCWDIDEGVSLDVGCGWIACWLCLAVCQLAFQEFAVKFIDLHERSLARRFLTLCRGKFRFLVVYMLWNGRSSLVLFGIFVTKWYPLCRNPRRWF